MNWKKNRPSAASADVVARLQEQVRQAQALASVPRQELLEDARLNPSTRGQADELTARRLSVELEMEHRRQLRRVREADRVEEDAARADQAVAAAQRATEPARSVLDMDRSRKRFTVGALAASVVCSVGSAISVEALAATWGAPTGIGYAAEVAMTGMATAAIAWLGGLARNGAAAQGRTGWVMACMIAVPLLASIVASTAGAGPIGAVCSIGAAAFAWFAYLVSVTGADAISQAMQRMGQRPASASSTPSDVTVSEETLARTPASESTAADELAAEAAEFLATAAVAEELPPSGEDDGGDGGTVAVIPRGDDEPTSTPTPERPGEDDVDGDPPASLVDAARRRSADAAESVRDYYADHPDAPVKRAAKELGLDPKTVRKYRPGGEGS